MLRKFLFHNKVKLIAIAFLLVGLTNFADNRRSQNERLLNQSKIKSTQTQPEFCQIISDSIDKVNRYMSWRLTSTGNSLVSFCIGVSEIQECDTCNSFESESKSLIKTKYFVALPNYIIKQNASYYIEKDKYYLDYFVPDSLSAGGVSLGHHEKKEIKVRYAVGDSDEGGTVLIPVSKQVYNFYRFLTNAVFVLLIIVGIVVVCIFPFSVLVNIAYGAPFAKSNIRKLSIIGWSLLTIPIINSIIPLIIGFFLRNKIPDQFYFPAQLAFMDSKTWLIAAVAILLFASAFKQGYKLQQEQDLTI